MWSWHIRFGLLLGMACMVPGVMVNAAETFSGHVTVGSRNVDVDGDDSKYQQHTNLNSGARLIDFGIVFEPSAKAASTPDRIEIFATDLGGDPYQNIRIGVRKYGRYRFTYVRQESEYFYKDILIDPANENPRKSNGGDFHRFDFDRVRDQVNFDVQLTDRAKVLLGFDQYTKKGDSTTVLNIEREEFELNQPIDQTLKNYDIGFEYRWDKAAVTFNQRWREFDNDVEIFLRGASEGSAPSAPTQLDSFFLEQPYGYNSRETQVGLTLRPTKRWDLQADVLYTDLDMDVGSLEMATGLDFLGIPLQTSLTGDGRSERTIRQLYLSTAYAITDRVRLTASVRDQNLDQDSDLDLDEVVGSSNWRIDSTSVALGLETIILDDWTLSGGWTTEKRDTDYDQASGGSGRAANEESQSDGYFLVVGYRPSNGLSLNISAEDNRIDDPFTLSSPTDSRRYRLRAGYKWNMGLKLNATYAWRKHENTRTGWEAKSEQTDLRLTYSVDPVAVSLGATIVELDRSIDQLVTAGSRQVLFPITYRAGSDFWDGLVRWHATEHVDVMVSYRRYDNDGSFEVKRDDARLGVNVDLPGNYSLSAVYRNIGYTEDFESFDADIWELSFGLHW